MAPLAGPGKETVSTKRGSEEEVLGGLLFLFYNLKFLISDAWLNLDLADPGDDRCSREFLQLTLCSFARDIFTSIL